MNRKGIVNITARSEAELTMRIQELEARGYTVKHQAPVEYADRQEINYDSTRRGKSKNFFQFNALPTYRVQMVRELS